MDILNTRVLIVEPRISLDRLQEFFQGEAYRITPGERTARDPHAPHTFLALELEISVASNRDEVIALLEEGISAQRPFALVCLDTELTEREAGAIITQVRESDPTVEYASIAFSEDPAELTRVRRQITRGLLTWNKRRNLETHVTALGHLKADRHGVETLVQCLLDQVAADNADTPLLIVEVHPPLQYVPWLGSGVFGDRRLAQRIVAPLCGTEIPEDAFPFETEKLRIQGIREGDLAALWEPSDQIHTTYPDLIHSLLKETTRALKTAETHQGASRDEKMSGMNRAIGTIVHNLRSPIGAIQSALDVALMAADDPSTLWEMLDVINHSAKDAMTVVGDILDFTGNSSINAQTFMVGDLLATVREKTLGGITEKAPAITIQCPPEIAGLGDSRKLQRALVNLVAYAARSILESTRPAPAVRLSAWTMDGTIRVAISDNGSGIPASIQATLFEPFLTQGPQQVESLSLAIAKRIIESHGGTLAYTTGASGTTFLVNLPNTAPTKTTAPNSHSTVP